MKLRAVVSVLAIATALTACSSSSKGGTGNVVPTTGGVSVGASTPVVVPTGGGSGAPGDFCANLTQANNKLSTLASTTGATGDFTALKAAIDAEVAAYQELANGAPAEVKPSIDDIVTVLQQAQHALADPTHPDVTGLQTLATKLPNDLTALANYLGTKCTGG